MSVSSPFSDTSTTDPQLAQELAQHSADYENTNLMAGARITDATVFNPGSAGGKMQCGKNNVELLCEWTDSGTVGGLLSNVTRACSKFSSQGWSAVQPVLGRCPDCRPGSAEVMDGPVNCRGIRPMWGVGLIRLPPDLGPLVA